MIGNPPKPFALMTQHPAEVPRLPKQLSEMLPVEERSNRQLTRPSKEVVDMAFQMFWSAMAPLRESGKLGMVAFQFDMTCAQQLEALEADKIDLGFIGLRESLAGTNLQAEAVASYEILVALPKAHPLSKKPKINLKNWNRTSLSGCPNETIPAAGEWMRRIVPEAGFTPRTLQEADGPLPVLAFVAAGLGAALLPEQVKLLAHPGVAFRPLSQSSRLSRASPGGWTTVPSHSADMHRLKRRPWKPDLRLRPRRFCSARLLAHAHRRLGMCIPGIFPTRPNPCKSQTATTTKTTRLSRLLIPPVIGM
jgi:DNA-binding transcriptional LysR family regulator